MEKDRLEAANAPPIEATEDTTPIAEESQDEKATDSNEPPTTEES
jgi:hypothetical protein